MIFIQGGTFQMGGTGKEDGKPIHTVTVKSFYVGTTEVTQKQWRDIMDNNPSKYKNCDNCPVEQVSWNEVQGFFDKLNNRYPGHSYRLPTEAEWEYAARGDTKNYNYTRPGAGLSQSL